MVIPTVIRVDYETNAPQATAEVENFNDAVSDVGPASARATRSSKNFTSALKSNSVASVLASNKSRQFTQQLSQVGQSYSATGNLAQSFSIQLADIGLLFGTVGTVAGALAGVGLPLLISALGGGQTASEKFQAEMKRLGEVMGDVESATEFLLLPIDELIQRYGEAARRVRQFALAQAELEVDRLSRAIQDQSNILTDVTEGYAVTQAALEALAGTGIDAVSIAADRLSKDLGITRQQAEALIPAFTDFSNAASFEAQQVALEGILQTVEDQEVALGKLPPELKTAVEDMLSLSNETDRARVLMDQLAAAAANVSIGTPLFLQGFEGSELLPPGPSGVPKTPSTRGGSSVDPNQARIEALVNSLQTEREILEEFRLEGLELLNLASEEELAALGGFNEAKLRLEQEYQDRLLGIKQKGADSDLATALGAGQNVLNALGSFNDKALRIAKVAGAAQAFISAQQGAAEALKLPYPANLIAASQVLATGLGFVSAIQGVSGGGGGGGGGGGTSGVAAGGAGAVPQQAGQNVVIDLIGDTFSRGSTVSLIERLNEEIRSGGRIDGILVG